MFWFYKSYDIICILGPKKWGKRNGASEMGQASNRLGNTIEWPKDVKQAHSDTIKNVYTEKLVNAVNAHRYVHRNSQLH